MVHETRRVTAKVTAEPKIEARPRNWITPVALVLLREESSYGYELMERLEQFDFEQIRAGTLYRTLRRMEQEGLCKSEWERSRVDRLAECTRSVRVEKRIWQPGRRRVSSTRMLWTASTRPIRVGSTPKLPSTV